MPDSPSRSETFGPYNSLSDRLDALDLVVASNSGSTLRASAILLVTTTDLTAPESIMLWWRGYDYSGGPVPWFEEGATYSWGDVWSQEPNTHVLLIIDPGGEEGTAFKYAKVTEDGYEIVPVFGGTSIAVSCGGGPSTYGSPVLWVGVNFDSDLFGGTDPLTEADWFQPMGVDVLSQGLTGGSESSYYFSRSLADAYSVKGAFDVLDRVSSNVQTELHTEDYTLVPSGLSLLQEVSGEEGDVIDVLVPEGSGFVPGDFFEVTQLGAAVVALSVDEGATLNGGTAAYLISQRYGQCVVRYRGSGEWVISGDVVLD